MLRPFSMLGSGVFRTLVRTVLCGLSLFAICLIYEKYSVAQAHDEQASKKLQTTRESGEARKDKKYWLRDATKDKEYWLRRIAEWKAAVENHTPGMMDEAAITIGGWPAKDIYVVHQMVISVSAMWRLPALLTGQDISSRDIVLALNLETDLDEIHWQAVLLYTDIVLLQLDTGSREGFERSQMHIVDGRGVSGERTIYWDLAIQLVNMDPAKSRSDSRIRQWLAATGVYLLGQGQVVHADPILNTALRLFPSDPQFLFYAGVLHEIYAAPIFQNARDLNKDESRELELKNARKYFEKSVKKAPGFFDGWLRLGRVRGLLGDHKRAIEDLKKAADGLKDRGLCYYCALFLGDELSAIERKEEARRQYALASILYPNAQTPMLCLSRLDHETGNFEGAVQAVKNVFALSAGENPVEDPMRAYEVYPARNASALLAEMYGMAGEQVR